MRARLRQAHGETPPEDRVESVEGLRRSRSGVRCLRSEDRQRHAGPGGEKRLAAFVNETPHTISSLLWFRKSEGLFFSAATSFQAFPHDNPEGDLEHEPDEQKGLHGCLSCRRAFPQPNRGARSMPSRMVHFCRANAERFPGRERCGDNSMTESVVWKRQESLFTNGITSSRQIDHTVLFGPPDRFTVNNDCSTRARRETIGRGPCRIGASSNIDILMTFTSDFP